MLIYLELLFYFQLFQSTFVKFNTNICTYCIHSHQEFEFLQVQLSLQLQKQITIMKHNRDLLNRRVQQREWYCTWMLCMQLVACTFLPFYLENIFENLWHAPKFKSHKRYFRTFHKIKPCISWKWPIGRPNCFRSWAYGNASSTTACIIPNGPGAAVTRSILRPLINTNAPIPLKEFHKRNTD